MSSLIGNVLKLAFHAYKNRETIQELLGLKKPENANNKENTNPNSENGNVSSTDNLSSSLKDQSKLCDKQDAAIDQKLQEQGKMDDIQAYQAELEATAPERMSGWEKLVEQTDSNKTPKELEQQYQEQKLQQREQEIEQRAEFNEQDQAVETMAEQHPEFANQLMEGDITPEQAMTKIDSSEITSGTAPTPKAGGSSNAEEEEAAQAAEASEGASAAEAGAGAAEGSSAAELAAVLAL